MFGLHNDYSSEAKYLSKIIESYFGNKVSIVTPTVDSKKKYPWYSVSFVLYRTYEIFYEYERGFFSIHFPNQDKSGICILMSEANRQKFNNQESNESVIIENLKLIDNEIRLRLPDKFLTQFEPK